MKKYLILENIRSSENVGSIFRTADAIGIDKIFLIGITPRPIDRFGREQNKIAKTALGAEKTIDWEYIETISEVIQKLKSENIEIVSLEQSANSIDYKSYTLEKDFALILGAEVDGVSKEALEQSDVIIEIPMVGEKESLNVSVAVGIALFRILD